MHVEEELKTYLMVLWRYLWLIILCALLSFAVAIGISKLLTPKYTATAKLRVASAAVGSSDYTYYAFATRLSNTFVDIATSDISLDEVAKRLGLPKQPKVEVEIVPETELITIKTSNQSPTLARDIANTLAGLMVEQSEQLYGGGAPSARQILEEQMQQAKTDLDASVAEYDKFLRSQPQVTSTIEGTPMPNPDLEAMAQLITVRQQLYADLLQRYENARTNELLRANAISIVEQASVPIKPSSPKLLLNAALGLAGGLMIGVILAFIMEGMDQTIRDLEEVQSITSFPILSTIPYINRRHRYPRDNNLPEPVFDQLRSRLILNDTHPKSTTFLLTSPEPGAGKSTIVANLAESLALIGNRVVLVDMDFHRPSQHTNFGIENNKGLSNFMIDEVQLEEVIKPTRLPNLRIITSGIDAQIPFEWLTPGKISKLFERLGKVFDYVLVDAPALLSVAETMMFATQVDAVILVISRHKTDRKHLRYALQQLTEIKAKVAGVILNFAPYSPAYSYYYRGRTKHSARPAKDTYSTDI